VADTLDHALRKGNELVVAIDADQIDASHDQGARPIGAPHLLMEDGAILAPDADAGSDLETVAVHCALAKGQLGLVDHKADSVLAK
jgi:hypothetical protein